MEQMSMFDSPDEQRESLAPLASRLRPDTLDDYCGQQHLIGKGHILRQLIDRGQVSSMIFWGPPGVGKTTLARIIARTAKAEFVEFSAVTSGIKEVKEVMQRAEHNRMLGQKTLLFADEIHRFNKAQQDAFLPFVEKGSIILIGATTENPSFEINSALLSRCKVFILKPLSEADLFRLLQHALTSPKGFGSMQVFVTDEQLHSIAGFSNGDARTALNTLEVCVLHYNMISALHKSMRNSDPDAAVYWCMRMLDGGEDPLYIARRLVRFASEDIGMADSNALPLAISVFEACHKLGMPECDVHLTHCVVYLSMAPKSNSLYMACEHAKSDIRSRPADPVPLVIRNAPTKLMEDLEYGKGYEYAHDTEEKLTRMVCLPDALAGTRYYLPGDQGDEQRVHTRLDEILEWESRKP